MKYRRLAVRDMGVFRGEHSWEIPDAGITAVVGPNGSGKTTFLGLLPGTIHRQVPTRGNLIKLARARDSFAELKVEHAGREYTFRQSVDCISRNSESLVMSDGVPVVESVKVSDVDPWVERHFPAFELVLASTFSAQRSRGFVGSSAGERKHLLLELLGVDHLEGLAKEARDRASREQTSVDKLVARIADEQGRASGVDQLQQDRAAAHGEAEQAARVLEQTRAELRDVLAAIAQNEAAGQIWRVAIEARHRLKQQLAVAQARLVDLESRIANNRGLIDRAPEIRAAVARVQELDAEAARARKASLDAERDRDADWKLVHAAEERMASELRATQEAKLRAERASARLADAEKVRSAAASLDTLRVEVGGFEAGLYAAERELEDLRGRRLVRADERIVDLRSTLTEIHKDSDATTGALRSLAGGAIERDDLAEINNERLPIAIEDAELHVLGERERLNEARRKLSAAEALAARLPDVESAADDLAAAEREQAEHSAAATTFRDEARQHTDDAESNAKRALDERNREMALAQEATQHQGLANQAEHLERAEARLTELDPQASEARAELERLQAELDASTPPTAPSAPPSPERLARMEKGAEAEYQAAVRRGAELDARIQAAQDAAQRATELHGELDTASAELADWTRLGSDLGRKGLQAALIDAALGEITATANWLLHESFGPRWTVRLDSQRLAATGKRQIEGLEIMVLDTENGREDVIETYSGGEETILAEAISLALAALASRPAGLEHPTLIRDESGAALDPEKAAAYVAMLRRGAEMIGASGALIVSHSPDVVALCDARIEL